MKIMTLAILGAMILLLPSCSQKLEGNAEFLAQVDRIDKMAEDLDVLDRRLTAFGSEFQQMRGEFQKVSQDVAATVTGGGGSPDALRALEQRLVSMEAALTQANDGVAALQKRLEGVESRSARVTAAEKTPAAASPAPARSERATAAAPRAEAPKEPAPVKRTFHQIKPGETIEVIAESYAVGASQIRAANHIPPGKNVAAGQRIVIPIP